MSGNGRHTADAVLIAALAGGATILDAAEQGGVNERTVRRRLEDADFKRQVNAARAELIAAAVGKLAGASTKAVETLEDLLDEPTAPAVRLGSARAILELGAKLREGLELEVRIAELEARLSQQAQQAQENGRWRS